MAAGMPPRAALLIGLAAIVLPTGAAWPAGEPPNESPTEAAPGSQAAAPEAAAAVLPEDRIAKQVAEKLGVQVLKVTATDAKDPPTYAVRVMNPPGNDNSAFVVSTLLVDAATGAILGQVHPVPSAARPDAMPLSRTPEDADGGRDLRRRTFR
jgi:hypothetical protein